MTDGPAPPVAPPVVNPDGAGYWAAAREERLCVQRCLDCGALRFPPRLLCACGGDRSTWHPVGGGGRVHTFTIVPIVEAEQLGLCAPGEGAELFLGGATRRHGRLPINTHGGLLSYAQAGASGGMHGLVEAVRQLRGGQGARQVARHDCALVHNEGGVLTSHATVILGRERR